MTASEKLFPKATVRPWEVVVTVVAQNTIVVGDNTVGPSVSLIQEKENHLLARHAVNTFDARDEVLREAGGSIERLINVSAAMSRVPYGSVAATAKAEAAYNAAFDALTPLLVKIQSALAVKP